MSDPDPLQLRQAIAELRDVNKEKRRTAVMKLGMMGGDEAVKTLIMVMRNPNEDLIVRGRAAMMLGHIGDARAVEALIEALSAPGYQTPLHAAEALGRIGDPRAIEPLRRMLSNHHDNFRKAAEVALLRLGCTPEPLPAEAEPTPQPVDHPHAELADPLSGSDDAADARGADAVTEPQSSH
ncbi:MAG: HEAT repeat domain-containing protein [Candidatus Flexifilum sp.]